jgi:Tfp pilus assembly protein PilV
MKKIIQNLKHQTVGFTLMEVLVASGIFIIMVLAVLGIFSSVLKAQRNTLAQTRLERETQLIMETMVKSIRSARVDYAEYEAITGSSNPVVSSPTSTLILINNNDERILYQHNAASSTLDIVNSGIANPINSEIVAVTVLDFFIEPLANPFIIGSPPVTQPRVTVVISLSSTQTGETAQAIIQQTVPQRGGGF